MPNDDLLTLRAPSQLVQRVTEAANRECSSMAAFVRRAVVRELRRAEVDFGNDTDAAQ